MTETQHVWLTQDARQRLSEELAELLRQRTGSTAVEPSSGAGDRDRTAPDGEPAAGWREREQRIRKLQEMLQKASVEEPPDDGVAEPGMVLTVRFAGDQDTETFLLAEREPELFRDIEVCSLDSPLGKALCWAKEGERREYRLPNGKTMTVTLVRAAPYEARSS